MSITDPSNALPLFQESFLAGRIPLQQGSIHSDLFLCTDEPNGRPRFSYLKLDGETISALVMFVLCERIDDIPCFNIGYAVAEAYRGRGIAKEAINSSIDELKNGFAKYGSASFFIEAVVGVDNEASKNVAAATLSNAPIEITDEVSGLPAYRYLRKIE